MGKFPLAIGLLIASGFTVSAFAGQWSAYASCDDQYIKDSAICAGLATPQKIAICRGTATDRLGDCNASKGKTVNSRPLAKQNKY
jgi:hypothetical protein